MHLKEHAKLDMKEQLGGLEKRLGKEVNSYGLDTRLKMSKRRCEPDGMCLIE